MGIRDGDRQRCALEHRHVGSVVAHAGKRIGSDLQFAQQFVERSALVGNALAHVANAEFSRAARNRR